MTARGCQAHGRGQQLGQPATVASLWTSSPAPVDPVAPNAKLDPRRGAGKVVEREWDVSLDLFNGEFERVRSRHGNGAIYAGSGGAARNDRTKRSCRRGQQDSLHQRFAGVARAPAKPDVTGPGDRVLRRMPHVPP